MLFSSIPFLYYFLPVVLILYFIVPKKLKNLVLLVTSLVFYGWGEPKYVILMIASILIGYISGLLIEAFSQKKQAKIFLALSVSANLGFLAYFKYADFFIENFNLATGLSVPLLKIALPIGISFYTFQILSYTVDVYRKDVPAQKNLINLAAYVTMFPQLIAGPIVRYSHIAKELEKAGADSIQLTARTISQIYDKGEKHPFLVYVDDLIGAIDIPVVLGGSLRDMAKINDVLNNSNVEFISMSKPFVAQPDFLKEWKENGEGTAICQSCNNCYSKKTSTCFKYP